MRLKIFTPLHVIVDTSVSKVVAEAPNGHFALLPRHIDFISALVPGILYFHSADGDDTYIAVDGGVLVKVEQKVTVATRYAISGVPLEQLEKRIEEQFKILDEHEKSTLQAMRKIEAGLVDRFLEIQRL